MLLRYGNLTVNYLFILFNISTTKWQNNSQKQNQETLISYSLFPIAYSLDTRKAADEYGNKSVSLS